MDKSRVDEMFSEFMEQQGVAQCRIVPNQVFGPRFAAPCSPESGLDQERLVAMSQLLRQYILPLITERLQESAALLDVFLGQTTPPSVLQFIRYGLPIRCGSYEGWRVGKRHGKLQECQQSKKGSGTNQAEALVTPAVRRTVEKVMGYELWLYRNATGLLDTHLELHGIHVGRRQQYACKTQTKQGCSTKQSNLISKWRARPHAELAAEIHQLTGQIGKSVTDDIKTFRKLAILESLLDEAAGPPAREDL